MERFLGTTAAIEILVCKLELEDCKTTQNATYDCKVFSGTDGYGEIINSSLVDIASFAATQVKELLDQGIGEECVVRFPENHLISANIYGRLHLLTGLSDSEQHMFFACFAREFRKRKLDRYNANARRTGIFEEL